VPEKLLVHCIFKFFIGIKMNKSLKTFFNVKDPVIELKINNASHARLEHPMTKAALFGLMKRFEPGDKLIQ